VPFLDAREKLQTRPLGSVVAHVVDLQGGVLDAELAVEHLLQLTAPLAAAVPGQRLRVFRVGPEDAPTLTFLERSGLVPGRLLTVREVRALDGVITVEDEEGKPHVLGESLARAVFVRSASESG